MESYDQQVISRNRKDTRCADGTTVLDSKESALPTMSLMEPPKGGNSDIDAWLDGLYDDVVFGNRPKGPLAPTSKGVFLEMVPSEEGQSAVSHIQQVRGIYNPLITISSQPGMLRK